MLVPALAVGYLAVGVRFRPRRSQIALFVAAELMLLAAFVTPLQTLAVNYLLTAHLLQNVVLAEWAPALLVLALPPAFALEASERRTFRAVTHPLVALPVWLFVYFAWHVPGIYDTALEHQRSLLHIEHVTYLAAGLLLWWPVIHEAPHRLPSGAKAVYLFAAFVLASPLGLLLALLPRPIYDFYVDAPNVWGISDLADQAIAGMSMASEEAIVFFVVFIVYFRRFLSEQEQPADELARALE